MIKQEGVLYNLALKHRNLILYGLIGSFAASIDYLLFFVFTDIAELHYLLSNVISVTAGITISFLLNRKYNFKVKDKPFVRFLVFITVGVFGLLLSSALLFVLYETLGIHPMLSKLLSIVVVVLLQFIANKHITFNVKGNG